MRRGAETNNLHLGQIKSTRKLLLNIPAMFRSVVPGGKPKPAAEKEETTFSRAPQN